MEPPVNASERHPEEPQISPGNGPYTGKTPLLHHGEGKNAENQRGFKYLDVITAAFVAVLLISNTVSVKPVRLWLFTYDGGTILFPLSYIFGDILTEVYGYVRSRKVIWLGFGAAALMALIYTVVGLLPAAGDWPFQKDYQNILGLTPRIVLASLIAYFSGEFSNSFVLAKMKIRTKGRWLWTRTIGSTLVGQGFDSLVFITLAFVGTIPATELVSVIITQWLAKSAYEAAITPLTYVVVNFLKRKERMDVFDYETRFNPLLIEE